MRWSATLIPTLRETPAEAVGRSHQLMLRAGLVRQVASGSYSYLPLGFRALRNVERIVREQMERAGAVEVLMPVLWPEELLRETGRLDAFGHDLMRFDDRHGRPHVLAPTHEEVVTAIARDELRSYRQLPLILYQIHTKFRDEPRPRFGVIRTREFIMKDAYSFGADARELDSAYAAMHEAYARILKRCGLPFVCVQADPGAMGGGASHEFIVPAEIGTASFVRCPACGYSANLEVARVAIPPPTESRNDVSTPREVATPGRATIDEVSDFLSVRPAQLIKTLIYLADGEPLAALVRGDHDINETKLARAQGVSLLELADPATIERVTGAPVGFAGPVGLEGVKVIADNWVMVVRDGVTGANRRDAHLVGVLPGLDFEPDEAADIRFAVKGDACPECSKPLTVSSGIEVGHIFRLGTKYSEDLDATFTDAAGRQQPFVMGCYGMGLNRLLAAAVETSCDDEGIIWTPALAPYQVLVLPLGRNDEEVATAALEAVGRLEAAGLDTLLDEREESPGVKFKDADLIGIPLRVVVGRGYAQKGTLELQVRRDGTVHQVAPERIAEQALTLLRGLRPESGA